MTTFLSKKDKFRVLLDSLRLIINSILTGSKTFVQRKEPLKGSGFPKSTFLSINISFCLD